MSTSPPPEPPPRPAPVDLEERGIDPAWVGVGLGAATLGLQALPDVPANRRATAAATAGGSTSSASAHRAATGR